MTDRPLPFKAPMIRAILREIEQPGTGKTQTRRVFKGIEQTDSGDWHIFGNGGGAWGVKEEFVPRFAPDYAPYAVGDRLWVRETWRCNGWATDVATIFFRGSEGDGYTAMCEQYPVVGKKPLRVTGTWRPGIHMPRWASRLTLTVTEVRVQRLQDISEVDAVAEGCPGKLGQNPDFPDEWDPSPVEEYRNLWDSLNADRAPWDSNPWVVAVTFTPALGNIDQVRP